ncbi:MAG: hypothetical protein IPJ07_04220 [Acidobacteria bacterium]|nr:hypothetical protein [Acidobacteriota bacterium]
MQRTCWPILPHQRQFNWSRRFRTRILDAAECFTPEEVARIADEQKRFAKRQLI